MTFPTAKLKRRPIMRYTDAANLKVIYSVSGDGFDDYVEAVGDPNNGCYEWLIRRGDETVKHSDCGYGMASIALRDGLIEAFGSPSSHDSTGEKR